MPPQFFVEFVFKSPLTDRVYWLPLLFHTAQEAEARKWAQATKTALQEHFEDIESTRPIPFHSTTRSYIGHRAKIRSHHKLAVMNVVHWEIDSIEPDPELNLWEQLRLIPNLEEKAGADLAAGKEYEFPVRVIKDGLHGLPFDEFLLLNIVKP